MDMTLAMKPAWKTFAPNIRHIAVAIICIVCLLECGVPNASATAAPPDLGTPPQTTTHQVPIAPSHAEGDDDDPAQDPPLTPEVIPVDPLEELLTVVEPGLDGDRTSLSPLGEDYDPSTGEVSFSTTDISLPGNDELPVELRRWVPLNDFETGGPSDDIVGPTGWAWNLPFIRGNYLDARAVVDYSKWDFGYHTWHDGYNCTGGADVAEFDNTTYFSPSTYWQGKLLHIPGLTSETFLTTTTGEQITKSNFRIVDCIINPWNENEPVDGQNVRHEGIVVAGPNGLTYTFNHIKSYYNGRVTYKSPRVRTRLLMVTKIEDRFGHFVNYVYDSDGDEDTDADGNDADDGDLVRIEASDGRTIEIAYETIDDIKRPKQASAHGRTWQYDYPNPGELTVTLPDGSSQWHYQGTDAVRFDANPINTYDQRYGDPPGSLPPRVPGCGTAGAPHTVTVTSPQGLQTTYVFADTVHNRSDISSLALDGTVIGDYHLVRLLHCTIHRSLLSRVVTSAGVEPHAWTYTWTYGYSTNRGTYDGQNTEIEAYLQAHYGDPELVPAPIGGYPAPINTEANSKHYRSVTIEGPEQTLVYYIDRTFHAASENMVVARDVLNASGTELLQRTQITHTPVGNALGRHWYVGTEPVTPVNETQLTQRIPVTQSVIKRYHADGNDTFTTTTSGFDSYGFAGMTVESNNFNPGTGPGPATRTTQSTWQHTIKNPGTANEVRMIGLPRTVTINGTEVIEHHYEPTTLLRDWTESFGKRRQTLIYYQAGTQDPLDQIGLPKSSEDANQHTTTYSHWKRGIPQTVTYADETPLLLTDNPTRTVVVDNLGQISSMTDETLDTTAYYYDDLGRLARIEFPSDTGLSWSDVTATWQFVATEEYGVNAKHWQATRTNGTQHQVTVFDALLRPVLTMATDSATEEGSMIWRQFDAAGREVFTAYPMEYAQDLPASVPGVSRAYDALGRITATLADSDLAIDPATTTQHLSGNRIKHTDPNGHITTTTYQAFGSPTYQAATKVAFADGTVTTIVRDVYGKPTSMTQHGDYPDYPARTVTHTFHYDDDQRLCLQTSPETGRTGYGYYDNGLLKWSVQGLSTDTDPCASTPNPPAATTVYRSYDPRDRLLKINYPTGTPDASFTYYNDGKLDTATRGTSKWDLNWLHRGLLDDETLTLTSTPTAPGSPYTIDYGYNDRGQRSSLQYPSGLQIALDPDAMGRPQQLGVYAGSITYDAWGAPTTLSYGNGTSLAQHRNTRGLIDSTEYAQGGWSMIHRALAYDANGNLETITGSGIGGPVDRLFADGFEGTSGSLARSFAYDAIDRLTSASSSQYGSESFRYDPLGNLRSHTLNGVSSAFDYDASTNRLSTVAGANYVHDTRGNVTAIGSFALTYNRANEVILDSKGTDFEYDARGWRFHQDFDEPGHPPHNRYFVYDSQDRLIERIDNGVVTDFVYLGSMPVARIEGTTTATYIHPDYQRTPILETDPSGNITRSPVYLAYGFVAEGGGNYKGLDRAPGYAGTYPEIETGLNYMGARYYFGAIGRFLAPDPAPLNPLHPAGLNRYAYAASNPVRFTDRTGRAVDFDFNSVGAVIDAMTIAVYLAQSPTAMNELNQIVQSNTQYTVVFSQLGGTYYSPQRKAVHINTRSGLEVKSSGKIQSPAIGAAHEISHAAENDRIGDVQYRKNAWLDRPITVTPIPQVSPEEQRATRVESRVSREVGELGYRKSYIDFTDEVITTCGPTGRTKC